MLLRHRLQEWAADRFSWVQYPDIRNLQSRRLRFKTAMPWEKRVGLVFAGLFTLLACGIALFLLGILAYALFTA